MPFASKAQMRYLFTHQPDVAEEFAKETLNFKDLPERVKKAMDQSFAKIAKDLFDPVKSPPVPQRIIQQRAIDQAKEERTGGMGPIAYRNELTNSRTGIVRTNINSAKSS